LNLAESDDEVVRKLMMDENKFLFIHPFLYNNLKNNSKGLDQYPKHMHFFAWSMAIFILLFIYKVDIDYLKERHRACREKGEILEFELRRILPEYLNNSDFRFIRCLLNFKGSQEEHDIIIYFQNSI
jgi:hypothetical protein